MVQNMIRHKGYDKLDIPTDDNAAEQLRRPLMQIGQHPVLLVSEDIWPASEPLLEKVVYKRIPDYKILVASRLPTREPLDRERELPLGASLLAGELPHLYSLKSKENSSDLFPGGRLPEARDTLGDLS
ncbi:hypothetical protein CRG98_001181 [Punica granatum]|uniref:NB-ARC domain-containing protein n=1 Tax=Punica granatum TaxID=22663 RepID=A0A2I0LCM4_PUNGR|nr:hypothetical protein CRG98_001181 [Punica granatum]